MKTSDEKLRESENERNERMDIIGQNGNDGEHYLTVGNDGEHYLTVSNDTNIGITPKSYKLNVNNIHDLEDIKDILEQMNFQLTIYGEGNSNQKRLIEKGLFEEI